MLLSRRAAGGARASGPQIKSEGVAPAAARLPPSQSLRYSQFSLTYTALREAAPAISFVGGIS
jgi:hypothetical protein